MKLNRLPVLAVFLTFLLPSAKLSAQSQNAVVKYLEIRLEDETNSRILLNDDEFVTISVEDECLKFKTAESEGCIKIDKISSLGIIEDEALSSYMSDYFNTAEIKNWYIFNSSGAMIKSGFGSNPDISALPDGQIYIIKADSGTIKIIK